MRSIFQSVSLGLILLLLALPALAGMPCGRVDCSAAQHCACCPDGQMDMAAMQSPQTQLAKVLGLFPVTPDCNCGVTGQNSSQPQTRDAQETPVLAMQSPISAALVPVLPHVLPDRSSPPDIAPARNRVFAPSESDLILD